MIEMHPPSSPSPESGDDSSDPAIDTTRTTVDSGPPSPAPPPGPSGKRRSPARAAGAILLAVALLAGGAGVGWVLADQSPAPELSISGGTTLTTSAPAVEIVPGDEPVADVAAALLPSMV
jgi:hypothetical protein